ncbi:site-specific integrase [Methylomonas sp. LL1]|uniref:tyrosine-type recombinase/integrase n=1 Tax=Methylomonas sp. LL1 TaxID=2785785 RepID=UPI0018C3A76A|nr:site-specific integrase [Methylomonas sp. LL1]QPK62570.1 site-specific integrase [Methylomonas sp. LL1]
MASSPKFQIRFIKREIDGKVFYSFFDNKGQVFYPPTDYLIDMADRQDAANGTVEDRACTLRVFFQYLSDKNIDYLEVDDNIIEEFRDNLLNKGNRNRHSTTNNRKISINVYLRQIYNFYKWVQGQEPRKRILGVGGHQITSSLLASKTDQQPSLNYPKCFQRVGENSKHTVNFVPSDDQYNEMFDFFLQARPNVASRNTLMLMTFRKSGLRVGSVASLTVDQFNEAEINKCVDVFLVRPKVQKFGYSKEFEIPLTLAIQILNYIKTDRQEIVNKFQAKSSNVFLSTTKGTALKSNHISNLFYSAAIQLGWDKKGVGLHCLRRLFACETIDDDIDCSIELGLDTSIEAVGLRTAQKLGHNSILSQQAYIRHNKRRRQGSATHRLNEELQAEKDKNTRLSIENAELRRMLEQRSR